MAPQGAGDRCWYLYLIETAGGALYTGITTDVTRRLAEHGSGRGAKALRGKGPLRLVHQEVAGTRGEALRLEAAVKRLSAPQKRAWLDRRHGASLQGPRGLSENCLRSPGQG